MIGSDENGIWCRGLTLAVLAGAMLALSGCGDLQSASQATERANYSASFVQVPLVADATSQGRVLKMHVFEKGSGKVPRQARVVPFHAQLTP